jgi:hypothetical protein
MNNFVSKASALLVGMSALTCSCFSGESTAAALPARDIPELAASADLIVLGEVERADIVGPNDEAGAPLSPLDLVIGIRRVLSGSLSTGSTNLTVRVSGSQRRYLVNVYPGQVGVVFLRRGENGLYVQADPYYLFVVAREPRQGRLVAGSAPLSAIADDLLQILRAPDAVAPAGIYAPPQFSSAEATPLEGNLCDAADELKTIPAGITQNALQRIAADANVPLLGRIWAIDVLLDQNDSTFIGTVVDVLNRRVPDVGGFTRIDLANELEDLDLDKKSQGERDRDAKAVLPLLNAKDAFVREAAVGLLRNSRSQIAVRPLLRALADDNSDIRYLAVYGLGIIVPGQLDAPSIDLFRQNEEYYVSFWRRWGAALRD